MFPVLTDILDSWPSARKTIFEDSGVPFQITSFDFFFFFFFLQHKVMCVISSEQDLYMWFDELFHPNITYRVKTGLSKYQISITKPCTPTDIALNVCWHWLCVNYRWLIALAMCKLGHIAATGFVGAGWLKWVSSISTGRDKKSVSSLYLSDSVLSFILKIESHTYRQYVTLHSVPRDMKPTMQVHICRVWNTPLRWTRGQCGSMLLGSHEYTKPTWTELKSQPVG